MVCHGVMNNSTNNNFACNSLQFIHHNTITTTTMVSRRELINVCTALLCAGSATTAAAAQIQRLRSRSHAAAESEWLDQDKPTNHPTTHRYFTVNYQNNNGAHPLHHFYYQNKQDQDEPEETYYYPTPSPTDDATIISTSMPSSQPSSPTHLQDTTLPDPASTIPSPDDPSDAWEVLTREHFIEGYGVFQEVDSEDTHHYASKLGREGVVKLQKTSSLPSHAIAVDSNKLKVAFSFYANSMTVGEGFCLEYSINDDDGDASTATVDWHPVRCWQSSIDFENSKWNDNFNVELNLDHDDTTVQVDSLRIKFVSIASRDDVDVMFDHITLLQS